MNEEQNALDFLDWLDGDRTGEFDVELAAVVSSLEVTGSALQDASPELHSDAAARIYARVTGRLTSQRKSPVHSARNTCIGADFEPGRGAIVTYVDRRVADDNLDAVVRVRASLPIGVSDSGVAHRRIVNSESESPKVSGRPGGARTMALVAAVFLLLAGVAFPVATALLSQFTLNKVAEVVAVGDGAEALSDGRWHPLKVGSRIVAGQSIRTSSGRVVLKLHDSTVIRFDQVTYGTLDLTSSDPTVSVGEGRVYVEVNGSGAVAVKVDGVTVASHEPGSGYTVEKDGVVVTSEGRSTVTTPSGQKRDVPAGHRYVNGEVIPGPDDSEWARWNRSGGRE